MAQHIGIVTKKESIRYAHVVTDRKGACGGCESTPHGCGSCLANVKIESRVANPLGAEPGDVVKIRLATASLCTGSAILYLLPVLGLVLGAFAGVWVSTAYGLTEMFGSIAGAVAGLVIGLAVVIVLDRSARFRRWIMPRIESIVKPARDIPQKNSIQ